jgi:acyl carrier protein
MTQNKLVTAAEILSKANRNGLVLSVDGEELKIDIQKGNFIHPSFILEVRKYENEISLLLQGSGFLEKDDHHNSLAVIEEVLRSYRPIRQAKVIVHNDGRAEGRLIGYIVADEDLDRDGLQTVLQSKLPKHMLPSVMIELPSMPLTGNDEIDVDALPLPDDLSLEEDSFVAPVTETQKKLAAIWREVLSVDQVGLYDNFFELGGHSILEFKLLMMIKRDIGIQLSIKTLSRLNNIKLLADYIDTALLNQSGEESDMETMRL